MREVQGNRRLQVLKLLAGSVASIGLGTFQGHNVAGVTVLTKDAAGLIESIHTHGQQFKAPFLRASPPTSADGIEKYLSSS